MLQIYTDGGCRNNPGLGAWAFVVIAGETQINSSASAASDTTNNRMELTAIYAALRYLYCTTAYATIYSDSQYAIKTITEWAPQWMTKGTLRSHKNSDLVERIIRLYDCMRDRVFFQWVKGHADNRFNNLADRLVNEAMDGYLNSATSRPPSL